MACSWKAALRSWLGVLVALAITVVISVLIRTFNLFCSDPLDDLCSQRHATLTVTVLMACLWVVGKPHCAVVAMFPVILLPMMGVGGKKYALDNQYFNHVNFILLGSFLLAFAIEEVGLHHRLALKLLSMVPGDPKLVLLAMMCISALLSAFMSNTATASLMCPLATSLYEEIKGVPPEEDSEEDVESTSEGSGGVVNVAKLEEEEHLKQLFKKIMLGVAYSCSIGGISTKTGTGTNLAFMGIYSNLTGQTISYGRWILVGLPISVLMILAAWMELTLVGGLGRKGYRFPTETLKARYEKLGKTTMPEIVVEVLCVLTVLGWFFRAPAWGPGLSDLFPDPKAFTDATVVLLCTLPLFFIPRTKVTDCGDAFDAPILQWSKIQSKMPMGLFLLIGAGFAISRAFDVSGLSVEIGLELKTAAEHLWFPFFQMVCVLMAACLSQTTSDVAVANILLPITFGVAKSMEIDPLLLMLPVGLACSLPFTLVVSTPPNAIAFQTGLITQKDLLGFGLPLTILGMLILYAGCSLIGFQALGVQV